LTAFASCDINDALTRETFQAAALRDGDDRDATQEAKNKSADRGTTG